MNSTQILKNLGLGAMVFPIEDSTILNEHAQNLTNILEFGPGLSTHAFIDAECTNIVTCEHALKWYDVAVKRFEDYPQVKVLSYNNTPFVQIPQIPDDMFFDLAFVDNPVGARNKNRVYHRGQEDCARWNTLEYALNHSNLVFLHDCKRPDEQNSLKRAKQLGWKIKEYATKRGLAKLTKD